MPAALLQKALHRCLAAAACLVRVKYFIFYLLSFDVYIKEAQSIQSTRSFQCLWI